MSTSNPESPRGVAVTEKQKRRANSCLPCRESKSRCTGGIPCATCLKKRQKPRCVYRNLTPKEVEADELLENTFAEQDETDLPATTSQQEPRIKEDPGHVDDSTLVIPLGEFFGPFSLSRTVDEYRQSSSSESSIQDVVDSMLTTQAFLTDSTDGQGFTSSQATVAQPSGAIESNKPLLSTDMDSQLPKHIRWLYSKYLSVCQMLDTGRVTQAWTTFPSFVREIELYGLDQDHTAEENTLSHEIIEASRRLWWHVVDLDLRLSLLVGRRPHLQPNALEFPRPSFSGLRADEKRLQQSKFELIQFKMELLTSFNTDKSQATSVSEERQPKQEVVLKRFEKLQEKAPGPSQDGSKDIVHSIAVAEHQLDIHLFSIVLHHHLARVNSLDQAQPPSRDKTSTGQSKPGKSRNLRKQSSGKTQKDMFQSARRVMELFDFIYMSDTSRSALSWTQCFGAYSAAVILGVARLRQEVDLPTDSSRIQHTLKVFQDLTTAMPALSIVQLATGPLENLAIALDGLEDDRGNPTKMESVQIKRSPKIPGQTGPSSSGTQNKRKRETEPIDTTFRGQREHQNQPSYEDDQYQDKRARFSPQAPTFDGHGQSVQGWAPSQEHQYSQHGSSFRDTPMASFHDQSASANFEQPFPPSATTSFTGNEPMEYSNLDYGSAQDGSHHYNSVEPWYHPPMSIHPPMYSRLWQAQGTSFTILGDDGIQHSFYGDPSPMAMNNPHHLDQQMHNQQSMMLNNMGHGNPQHGHDGSLKDRTAIPGQTQTSLGPEHVQSQHDASFYSTGEETQYAASQHPASSPIIGNVPTPREGVFAHPADSTRRRSVADIKQQQRGVWNVETPANYNEPKSRGKGKPSIEQSRTPPRDGILSPLSEVGPQSRRNSATPRQIAQQGMPINLTQHLDFSLDEFHPPMMLPVHSMHTEEYPGSRRASLAHGVDVNMFSQANTISEPAPTWQSQAHPPVSQTQFDAAGTMSYDLEMTNNAMAYNAQFHQHQHQQQQNLHHHLHHSHHDFSAPSRQIVTTGPYPNDTRWRGS